MSTNHLGGNDNWSDRPSRGSGSFGTNSYGESSTAPGDETEAMPPVRPNNDKVRRVEDDGFVSRPPRVTRLDEDDDVTGPGEPTQEMTSIQGDDPYDIQWDNPHDNGYDEPIRTPHRTGPIQSSYRGYETTPEPVLEKEVDASPRLVSRKPEMAELAVKDTPARTALKMVAGGLLAAMLVLVLLWACAPGTMSAMGSRMHDTFTSGVEKTGYNPESKRGPAVKPKMVDKGNIAPRSFEGISKGGGTMDGVYAPGQIRPHQIQIPAANFSIQSPEKGGIKPLNSKAMHRADGAAKGEMTYEGDILNGGGTKWLPTSNLMAASVGDKVYVSQGPKDRVEEYTVTKFDRVTDYKDGTAGGPNQLTLIGKDPSGGPTYVLTAEK